MNKNGILSYNSVIVKNVDYQQRLYSDINDYQMDYPDYSAEKQNNISEVRISINMHFSTVGYVNCALTLVSYTWLMSSIIISMIVHRPLNKTSTRVHYLSNQYPRRWKR